jgi:hypothetical protein
MIVLITCVVNRKDCKHYFLMIVFVHTMLIVLLIALVDTSRELVFVHEFFTNLNFIINVASASCKRHDQPQVVHATQIAHMRAIGELETGKGVNQICTLK